MWLGIIGAITMTACSMLWLALSDSVSPDYYEVVLFFRLASNAGTGLAIGLLISRLRKLSAIDSLTQVYNRGYFLHQLSKHLSLAKRHRTPLSLVLIDLDRFKEHNDTFGHLFGDRVLRQVALQLKSLMRASDIVGRYGGDEFIVMLPHTDTHGAICLMQRVKKAIVQLLQDQDITFSAGIASFPLDGDTAESLLARADKALYTAKSKRDSIQSYQDIGIAATAGVNNAL